MRRRDGVPARDERLHHRRAAGHRRDPRRLDLPPRPRLAPRLRAPRDHPADLAHPPHHRHGRRQARRPRRRRGGRGAIGRQAARRVEAGVRRGARGGPRAARCRRPGPRPARARPPRRPRLLRRPAVLPRGRSSWSGSARTSSCSPRSEDVEASKPEPDLVGETLSRLGGVERAVFVGDTPYDVEAAGRAGLRCLAVLSGGFGREELLAAGAADGRRRPGRPAGPRRRESHLERPRRTSRVGAGTWVEPVETRSRQARPSCQRTGDQGLKTTFTMPSSLSRNFA